MLIRLVIFSCLLSLMSACEKSSIQVGDVVETPAKGETEALEDNPTVASVKLSGGELVACTNLEPNFPFPDHRPWYVADYAEIDQADYKYDFSKSTKERLSDILLMITESAPELRNSFIDFLNSVPFGDLPSDMIVLPEIEREWVARSSAAKQVILPSEEMPSNCLRDSDQAVFTHQVVEREESVDSDTQAQRVVYYYDEVLLDKVGDKPLQLSMLLFHQWLWDHFGQGQGNQVREVNRVFHSHWAETLTEEEIRKMLKLPQQKPPAGPISGGPLGP